MKHVKALVAVTMGIMTVMNSCSTNEEQGPAYIGPSDIAVQGGKMTAEMMISMGRVSDPQLSPDGKTVLYGVSYTSIEQDRSCRNLYLCAPDGSNKVQLTNEGKSISNARWSDDGKTIFFIQGGQMWSAPLNGSQLGAKTLLSDIPNGVSEFKLSPDQSKVYFLSTIKNEKVSQPADSDPKLDKAQAYVTEDLMYRHWDHWVLDTPRTYVASMGAGKITLENSVDLLGSEPYELPTEPFGGAEQLDWSPDGKYIVYSCRKHVGKEYAFSTNCGIYVYDVVTGQTTTIKGDGGYDTDPVWSPDGKHIAWISMARDGYEADQQRLMVVDVVNGGQSFENVRCMAPGFDYDVAGPFWNPFEEGIVFNSLVNGAQKIFCVGFDGVVKQITKDEWVYDFNSPFAMIGDNGSCNILASYSGFNFPTELISVSLNNGEAAFSQITNVNEPVLSQLDEPKYESVIVKTVDGKDMQCWILYPPHFDESKTYPAIEIVLGGPQSTNSPGWSYRWNYSLMAQSGYIVILPNRRGTTAFGQEWKEQISGDYCGLNMQDYLYAGRYIKSKPYVGKLACVGASYGGFSAYMLEGLHGDLYDCFVSHAGIFSEMGLWYTTEEMWFANWDCGGLSEFAYTPGQQGPAGDGITFGGLQQAGAPYATTPKAIRHYANDPESNNTKWHTPILCIHGMLDFRIPYTQGMAAFNNAQMMGVPSKLVIFPEENHWILKPQNSLFWHREVYDWLDRWCK